MTARFQREAKIASRLRSPHTSRLNDLGELESGVPYIEMQLFEGHDLAHVLRGRGPLPVDLAVSYVLQASHAVAEAHAAAIVHHDVARAEAQR
jgi:serine/threonine-protein kinase